MIAYTYCASYQLKLHPLFVRNATPTIAAAQQPTPSLRATPLPTPSSDPLKRTRSSREDVQAVQNALLAVSTSPTHLPPSKMFFLHSTGVHSGSFKISGDKEYYLFMNLRRDEGWRSDRLSDAQLYAATSLYNARQLKDIGGDAIFKRPVAIKQKLEAIEKLLIQKFKTDQWTSMSRHRISCFGTYTCPQQLQPAIQNSGDNSGRLWIYATSQMMQVLGVQLSRRVGRRSQTRYVLGPSLPILLHMKLNLGLSRKLARACDATSRVWIIAR